MPDKIQVRVYDVNNEVAYVPEHWLESKTLGKNFTKHPKSGAPAPVNTSKKEN